jgi:hypothetical protein
MAIGQQEAIRRKQKSRPTACSVCLTMPNIQLHGSRPNPFDRSDNRRGVCIKKLTLTGFGPVCDGVIVWWLREIQSLNRVHLGASF